MTKKINNPSDVFYWKDLESDQGLKACSFHAQGLWSRMLCICAKDPKGELRFEGVPLTPEGLASVTGKPLKEVETGLAELGKWKVFSKTRRGVIYNRRMKRTRALSEKRSKAGSKGVKARRCKQRENDLLLKQNGEQTPSKPRGTPSSPSSPKEIYKENNQETTFPKDSISFTAFEEIARAKGNGWDPNLVGDRFRPFAKKNPHLIGDGLEAAFSKFCVTFGKNEGRPN